MIPRSQVSEKLILTDLSTPKFEWDHPAVRQAHSAAIEKQVRILDPTPYTLYPYPTHPTHPRFRYRQCYTGPVIMVLRIEGTVSRLILAHAKLQFFIIPHRHSLQTQKSRSWLHRSVPNPCGAICVA